MPKFKTMTPCHRSQTLSQIAVLSIICIYALTSGPAVRQKDFGFFLSGSPQALLNSKHVTHRLALVGAYIGMEEETVIIYTPQHASST